MGNRVSHVYVLASFSRMLYVGVTSNLETRIAQHKAHVFPGYTQKYQVTRLVYYEAHGDIRAAIEREKQIKGWLRSKKVKLIRDFNPGWRDLSEDWWGKGKPKKS